jgi:hypothetical protein
VRRRGESKREWGDWRWESGRGERVEGRGRGETEDRRAERVVGEGGVDRRQEEEKGEE